MVIFLILQSMLVFDPAMRISAKTILQHSNFLDLDRSSLPASNSWSVVVPTYFKIHFSGFDSQRNHHSPSISFVSWTVSEHIYIPAYPYENCLSVKSALVVSMARFIAIWSPASISLVHPISQTYSFKSFNDSPKHPSNCSYLSKIWLTEPSESVPDRIIKFL